MSTTTPAVDPDRTLGHLVAERAARARVFEQRGIDYCCHGERRLRDAATEAGLDLDDLVAELGAVDDADGVVDATASMSVPELVDHIVLVHHQYLYEEMPLLEELAAKVASVHGERHPELVAVERLVRAIRDDLDPHLAEEEETVFPAIRRHLTAGEPVPAALLDRLRDDHEAVGALLAELRAATSDHAVPEDGCASYRSLYERLAHLESDTFRHIHLENNVLFAALTR